MNVAPGARRYALPPLLLAIPTTLLALPVGVALGALGLAVLWFYRDPERAPAGEGFVSPADGRVSVVREEGARLRVGVFMNVTDVHVNRAPAAGTVREVVHDPGAHRPAFSKDSDRNERVTLDCGDVDVVLIAGWFARRITPYVSPGDDVARGDRVGHISFGSRADVVLPPTVDRTALRVEIGDRVRAGETVVAAP
jgi:phosphatidylserine decarboxylase